MKPVIVGQEMTSVELSNRSSVADSLPSEIGALPVLGRTAGFNASNGHLRFLDGVRGTTAIYVLVHHAFMGVWEPNHPASRLLQTLAFLGYGMYAVIVFIVLSGFCLMLPIVRSGNGKVSGGVPSYFLRRCKRILPPYYAALALSLLLIELPGGRLNSGSFYDASLPVTPSGIISHLFLVHDARPDWFLTIDPPMWSVSIEWQIYILFPLILLPLWRRSGWIGTLIGSLLLAYAFRYLTRGRYDYAQIFFLFLFCIGMAGAAISYSGHGFSFACRRLPWTAIAALFLLTKVVACRFPDLWSHGHDWCVSLLSNSLIAASTSALLISMSKAQPSAGANWFNPSRIFENRWLVAAGAMSYSLYLIHYPLLGFFFRLLRRSFSAGPSAMVLVMILVASPVVYLISYVFYRVIEKPLLTRRGLGTAKTTETLQLAPNGNA